MLPNHCSPHCSPIAAPQSLLPNHRSPITAPQSLLPQSLLIIDSITIPELLINIGYKNYQEFSTKINSQLQFSKHNHKFLPGSHVIYNNNDYTTSEIITNIQPSTTSDELQYTIKTLDGSNLTTSESHISHPDSTSFSPLTENDYQTILQQLNPQQAKLFLSNNIQSNIKQEFMSQHNRLQHLPFNDMFQLSKIGVLPHKFLQLNSFAPTVINRLDVRALNIDQ